jgi:hypothetical protein
MAMSPRTLRPRATSGYDANAQAYFNAVALADGQQLETAVKVAINNFVRGCKADGIWDAIAVSCILMGARTLAGINVPLKGASPTFNAFTDSEYNRKTGLTATGATQYIDTGRAGNADGQDSLHFAAMITGKHTGAATGCYIASGNFNQTSATGYRQGALGAIGTARIRGQTFSADITTPRAFVGVRESSTVARVFADAQADNLSAGTVTAVANNWWVLGNNSTGSTNQFPCDGRVAFYSIGANLNGALLQSRIAALHTAIGAALP